VASRQTHGGENRSRSARFPAYKTLEDFDFNYQRSVRQRSWPTHPGALDFIEAKENVIFLGPPGTGKTHLATALGIRACQAGHRVAFATATEGGPAGAGACCWHPPQGAPPAGMDSAARD
jgi:DNA replication protein DnaC